MPWPCVQEDVDRSLDCGAVRRPADALTLVPVLARPNGIMLTSICRPRRGPENLDKVPKTRENRRSRGKCEGQDILPSMLYSQVRLFALEGGGRFVILCRCDL